LITLGINALKKAINDPLENTYAIDYEALISDKGKVEVGF
jgi:hypothetical protein